MGLSFFTSVATTEYAVAICRAAFAWALGVLALFSVWYGTFFVFDSAESAESRPDAYVFDGRRS